MRTARARARATAGRKKQHWQRYERKMTTMAAVTTATTRQASSIVNECVYTIVELMATNMNDDDADVLRRVSANSSCISMRPALHISCIALCISSSSTSFEGTHSHKHIAIANRHVWGPAAITVGAVSHLSPGQPFCCCCCCRLLCFCPIGRLADCIRALAHSIIRVFRIVSFIICVCADVNFFLSLSTFVHPIAQRGMIGCGSCDNAPAPTVLQRACMLFGIFTCAAFQIR